MIKTAYEYNNKSEIQVFPKDLGKWKGYDIKYSDDVYKVLNADILLSRAYTNNNSNIIWMDIINSKTGESFHKPDICVEAAGWIINNKNITKFGIKDGLNPSTQFSANRLDITKENKRQIMIYWFMFKKFGSEDAVSMIRISSPVNNNDINATFDSIKDFLEDQMFGAMYKEAEKDEISTAEYLLRYYGNKGLSIIAIAILVPIGIIIIAIKRKN